MSNVNGRSKRALEGLAAALQECLDAAVESGERRCRSVMEERFQQQDERFRQQDETLRRQNETLRKQNETLRMIWQQCGGRAGQRLPIDD